MMEVMQMGPTSFGPQFVGPGIGSIGGCVFEPSLGRGAFQRIAQNNLDAAQKAMVVDAATASSEQKGEIGHYKLLVRDTTYRNKITDEIVSERTLVSPDSDFEAAGVWTSAGEKNTVGTIEEYSATVNRARKLAQIDGDASMFWVSPSSEGDVHRAYLWIKKGEEVEAFQYIIPGRRQAVSTMMRKLGYQDTDSKPLEDRTIIRLGNEPKIHHKDVFGAVVSSLAPDEAEQAKHILNKFRQEAEIPDSFRKQRLKSYQGEYEAKLNSEKLNKVYENDIEKWLKSVAQGFAAIPRLDSILDQNKMISDQGTKDDRNNIAYFDYLKSQQRIKQADEQAKISEILQPIIPAVIGFIEIISRDNERPDGIKIVLGKNEITTMEKKTISNDDLVRVQMLKSREDRGGISRFSDDSYKLHESFFIDSSPLTSKQVFWQEAISMIFEPIDAGIEDNQMLFDGQLLPTQRSFAEALVEFIPQIYADKIQETSRTEKSGELTVLTTIFQQELEGIAKLLEENQEGKEVNTRQNEGENIRQKIVETDVVILGGELVGLLLSDKNILSKLQDRELDPQIDALARLSFLLHAYEDTDSSALLKQLIAVLIYKQIQTIQADKNLFSQNPKLIEIFNKFAKLSPDTDFLDTRFDLLFLALQKIYSIHKQAQFSIEKLQNMGSRNAHMMIYRSPNRKNIKNNTKIISPYGIIYQRQYTLA